MKPLTPGKAAARVIHELDEAGNVLRIGWEPATAVIDRENGVKAAQRLLNTGAGVLHLIHQQQHQPAELLASTEVTLMGEALTDLRGLMLALHRSYSAGIGLPRWETEPSSKRFFRRAA